ncbi:unnamed protein product [Diplocarpon coronariae]
MSQPQIEWIGLGYMASELETVKEVANKSEIIFSCVSNDAVLQEITSEIIASGSKKGKIYVDCSIIHPDTFIKIAEQITAAGAHVFAEKNGLGSAILETMIGDMFGAVHKSYSKRLTTGGCAPGASGKAGFGFELAMKDARHALNCAKAAGTRGQVGEFALENLEKASKYDAELGGRPLDSSAMYGTIRREAGLDFFTDLCKERDSKK